MPKPVEIGLGEIERGELLGDLDNQGREMEKNTKQYLALQALRRARRRRRAVADAAVLGELSHDLVSRLDAWIEPRLEKSRDTRP